MGADIGRNQSRPHLATMGVGTVEPVDVIPGWLEIRGLNGDETAEGIAVQGKTLWIAMQREWKDDPKGMAKLLAYDSEAESWGAVHYPLDPAGEGRWMGLSEITIDGDWAYLIERDNGTGAAAQVKSLTRVALADLKPAALGGPLPVVTKEVVRDLIPDLGVLNGYTAEKVEGFAIDAAGTGWVVTDNDGTDDSSGETLFWQIGAMR